MRNETYRDPDTTQSVLLLVFYFHERFRAHLTTLELFGRFASSRKRTIWIDRVSRPGVSFSDSSGLVSHARSTTYRDNSIYISLDQRASEFRVRAQFHPAVHQRVTEQNRGEYFIVWIYAEPVEKLRGSGRVGGWWFSSGLSAPPKILISCNWKIHFAIPTYCSYCTCFAYTIYCFNSRWEFAEGYTIRTYIFMSTCVCVSSCIFYIDWTGIYVARASTGFLGKINWAPTAS